MLNIQDKRCAFLNDVNEFEHATFQIIQRQVNFQTHNKVIKAEFESAVTNLSFTEIENYEKFYTKLSE